MCLYDIRNTQYHNEDLIAITQYERINNQVQYQLYKGMPWNESDAMQGNNSAIMSSNVPKSQYIII